MITSQHLRIETLAGGISCSNRAYIKAAHRLLSKHGRSREMRDIRHLWIKSGLKQHAEDKNLIYTVF